MAMNRDELRAALDALEASGVDLPGLLDVSAAEISRWRRGAARVPRIRARQIRWLLRGRENDERRAAAQRPTCPEGEALARRYQESFVVAAGDAAAVRAMDAASEALEEHFESCPTCAANEAWGREHLDDLGPFPMPGVSGSVLGLLGRVPPPLMPAALGALLLGGIVTLRLLVVLVILVFRFPGTEEALRLLGGGLVAVLAAAGAGAAGGLVIPVTAPLRRTLGAVGDYVTGILAAQAYMWSLAGVMPLVLDDTALVEGTGDAVVLVVLSAVFGVVGAHAYREGDRGE